jgi:hypothetical protein
MQMQTLTKMDKIVSENYHHMTIINEKCEMDVTNTSIIKKSLNFRAPSVHLHVPQNYVR